jgi:hypothetical protein
MKKAKTNSKIKCNVCNKPFKSNEKIYKDYDWTSDLFVGNFHWDCSFVIDMLQTKAGGKLYKNACKYLDNKYKLTPFPIM